MEITIQRGHFDRVPGGFELGTQQTKVIVPLKIVMLVRYEAHVEKAL